MRIAFLAFACLFLSGGVAAYFGMSGAATWLLTVGALGAVGVAGMSIGGHNVERKHNRH